MFLYFGNTPKWGFFLHKSQRNPQMGVLRDFILLYLCPHEYEILLIMRCKNCGWDNPGGNVRCEKCNAPMSSYTDNEAIPHSGYVSEEFNPKATAMGCSACGYPVRPTDTECPSCGHSFSGHQVEPEKETVSEKKSSKASVGGTIIQGVSSDKDSGQERKRLVGFLVTYSLLPNGDFFALYEGKNLIGRDEAANVCIQGDSNISERHLSILYRNVDRKFKFKDEQSSNGTFINDELTDEGELKNLDVIRVGATRLLFMEIPQGMEN